MGGSYHPRAEDLKYRDVISTLDQRSDHVARPNGRLQELKAGLDHCPTLSSSWIPLGHRTKQRRQPAALVLGAFADRLADRIRHGGRRALGPADHRRRRAVGPTSAEPGTPAPPATGAVATKRGLESGPTAPGLNQRGGASVVVGRMVWRRGSTIANHRGVSRGLDSLSRGVILQESRAPGSSPSRRASLRRGPTPPARPRRGPVGGCAAATPGSRAAQADTTGQSGSR